jgi:uncharacterized small protein (DUF1192 family)
MTTRRPGLGFWADARPAGFLEEQMPAFDDDDRPKKKVTHEIGQDLTLLSVQELNERIELMRAEIARLEADIARKRATRSAADQFFKT